MPRWEAGGRVRAGHQSVPPGNMETGAVEVKWGTHPAGEQRTGWTVGEKRSTLCLLVSGRFRIDLGAENVSESVVLNRPGDYVLWGPGTDHSWQAEESSVVVTIRWPSLT